MKVDESILSLIRSSEATPTDRDKKKKNAATKPATIADSGSGGSRPILVQTTLDLESQATPRVVKRPSRPAGARSLMKGLENKEDIETSRYVILV